MSMFRARSALGVGALLISSLLVGCDGGDDPPEPVESTSNSSASSSVSPTETPTTPTGPVEPTLPPEAESPRKAGAEAFVAHYLAVVSYARNSGDLVQLKKLSVPSCAGCNGGIRSIERVYDRGGRILGGRFSLLSATTGRTPSGAWNVSARVKVERSRTVGAGNLDQTVRPGVVRFLFGLSYASKQWRATFLDAL